MSGETAFQPDAFQNDAFQVGLVVIVSGDGNPSYEQRFFTDLESGLRRLATVAYADASQGDGGPSTEARKFDNQTTQKRQFPTGGQGRPRRSDGWRRQPPG